MERFSTLTAVAAPIDIDNLDTDQLMPKQFLHGIDKSGLAQGLLWDFRMNADGTPRKDRDHLRGSELRLRLEPRTCRLGTDAVRHPRRRCALLR